VAALFLSVYLLNIFGSMKVYPGVLCKVSFAVIAKWSEIQGLSWITSGAPTTGSFV
jgi:hypothetical protein